MNQSTKKPARESKKELSIASKLYRGETDFQFVPNRKKFYIASAIIFGICLVAMLWKGFALGIDFVGGTQFETPVTQSATLDEIEEAAEGAGAPVSSAQVAGTGDTASYVIRTADMGDEETAAARDAIAAASGIDATDVSVTEVSSTWGQAVSQQALIALLVFLGLVTLFIWIRFERRMAISAFFTLMFDLVLVAGIFAMVGFEVTPATLVGMLTILAYSLYDTVVVFDKVRENTAHLLQSRRQTYAEGANDAINLTLMRSINTGIIGTLPVGGLLFVGVGLLGVGTLRDLALVLFVGVLIGTFSSVFLAAPFVVDLANRNPTYRKHNQKVANKRAGHPDDDDEDVDIDVLDEGEGVDFEVTETELERSPAGLATTPPRPGARPASRGRGGSRARRRR